MISYIKRTIVLLSVMAIIGSGLKTQAQSKPQKEETAPNITLDIKKEIERLNSSLAVDRVIAASNLGKMGEKASPAIPLLIKLLDDHDSVKLKLSSEGSSNVILESETSVYRVVVEALSKIGKPAVEPLIAALDKKDYRHAATLALGKIGDPRAIEPLINLLNIPGNSFPVIDVLVNMTGKEFKGYEEWRKWWNENKDAFSKRNDR